MREFVLLYSHIKKKSFPGEKNREKKICSRGFEDRVQRSVREKAFFYSTEMLFYSVNTIFHYLNFLICTSLLHLRLLLFLRCQLFCTGVAGVLLPPVTVFFLSKTLTLTWCIKADGSGTEGWAALNPLVFTGGKKLHLGTSHGVTNVQWLVPSLSCSQI